MTTKNNTVLPRLKNGAYSGILKGWSGLLWLLKILVPISFATALLVHFGIIYKLDFILAPVMNFLMLPSEAALPIIIGLFTGIYGAVAAMAVIPLPVEQMTLIAIFLLISHNIIQESIVQGKSGLNAFVAAFFRIFISVVTTFVSGKIMGATVPEVAANATAALDTAQQPFSAMLLEWGVDISMLAVQIFCIIMPLMIVLETAKEFNLIRYITRLAAPVLAVMGLSRNTGMLWLTASLFGLAYGAAVIVEETKSNDFSKEELTKLHLSIGPNHAMIEDPALFLPLGIPALWLWIPRLVAAICITYTFNACCMLRRLHVKRTCHKEFCNN
ncbi:MAG: iron transporter [Thermodesulfobacteriota bacterium]